jgi:acetyl-CoA C-acetyltransferase
MEVLGRAAASHLGRPLREIGLAELYSCFPAAVRVQQRALQLDRDGTPTLTGGMTFAGGPFNNFVLQSSAALMQQLRQSPDELAMVTTVSGMLSKPGLAAWSCQPPSTDGGLLMADLAEEAVGHTPTLPVAAPETAGGTATVVSYTVTFDADEPMRPNRTAIVADLADGSRVAATCDDAEVAGRALTESLVGHPVHVDCTTFTP